MNSYKTQKLSLAGLTGPAIGQDGTAYVVTGSGPAVPPVYANSVVALTAKDLKVKDWYTPSASSKALNASPVVLTYKEKELIAAPGKRWQSCLIGQHIVRRSRSPHSLGRDGQAVQRC